jgi:hypothetical protein
MRKSLVSAKSDRFSLYTSMIVTYNNNTILIITGFGVLIVLLSTIISMFFNAWMVQYMLIGDQSISGSSRRHGLYESLKNIVSVTTGGNNEGKKKKIASLFILTTLISILGFVLTSIAVFPIADSLSLYLLQFVVLNII